jgi:hypothetical protein
MIGWLGSHISVVLFASEAHALRQEEGRGGAVAKAARTQLGTSVLPRVWRFAAG